MRGQSERNVHFDALKACFPELLFHVIGGLQRFEKGNQQLFIPMVGDQLIKS